MKAVDFNLTGKWQQRQRNGGFATRKIWTIRHPYDSALRAEVTENPPAPAWEWTVHARFGLVMRGPCKKKRHAMHLAIVALEELYERLQLVRPGLDKLPAGNPGKGCGVLDALPCLTSEADA